MFADARLTELVWGFLGVGHAVALLGIVGFVGATIGRPRGKDAMLLAACFVVVAAVLTWRFLRPAGIIAEFRALGFPDVRRIVPATFVATLFFAASWTAAVALARWAKGRAAEEQARAVLLSCALVVYTTDKPRVFAATAPQIAKGI